MLELDGKNYDLTLAETEKYSGRWIFRAGKQFIHVDKTGDKEMKKISVASVHVVLAYNSFRLQEKKGEASVRMSRGMLRYYQTKDFSEGQKKWVYSPQRIAIGYTGSIIVDNDPLLAYFLDNHPYNEAVRENVDHPNYSPAITTYFSTYRKEKVRASRISEMSITSELNDRILNPQKMGFDELKAIAQMVQRVGGDYKIAHTIRNISQMDEDDFRSELGRLAGVYPHAMKEIVASKKIDFTSWANKFIELNLIKITGDQWVISQDGKANTPLIKIKSGADNTATLIDWFQNGDKKNQRFSELKQAYQTITESLAKET